MGRALRPVVLPMVRHHHHPWRAARGRGQDLWLERVQRPALRPHLWLPWALPVPGRARDVRRQPARRGGRVRGRLGRAALPRRRRRRPRARRSHLLGLWLRRAAHARGLHPSRAVPGVGRLVQVRGAMDKELAAEADRRLRTGAPTAALAAALASAAAGLDGGGAAGRRAHPLVAPAGGWSLRWDMCGGARVCGPAARSYR
mmetsp:Transcript_40062/g.129705  ORF Transcript_40062/g.129705 Transcript_40062/m.129705 type:complete len:201 (+) Transcript_40062:552-1154(+)